MPPFRVTLEVLVDAFDAPDALAVARSYIDKSYAYSDPKFMDWTFHGEQPALPVTLDATGKAYVHKNGWRDILERVLPPRPTPRRRAAKR